MEVFYPTYIDHNILHYKVRLTGTNFIKNGMSPSLGFIFIGINKRPRHHMLLVIITYQMYVQQVIVYTYRHTHKHTQSKMKNSLVLLIIFCMVVDKFCVSLQ